MTTHPVPLDVAPAVHDWLSAEDLAELAEQARAGYRCLACGRPGGPAEGAASVVVIPAIAPDGGPAAVVRLAHARCRGSGVRAGAPAPLHQPPDAAMTATAAVLPHLGGPRPLLITEPAARVVQALGDGERHDAVVAALLGDGLHLLADAWHPAPPAAGWLAELTGPGSVRILDPRGGEYYAGPLDQPAPWRSLAVAGGTVELLAGVIGLRGDPGSPGAGVRALEAAARAGRLAGASIAARDTGQGR